jgi:hypothetical protein
MLDGFSDSGMTVLCFVLMGRIFSFTEICSEEENNECRDSLKEFLAVLDKFPDFKNKSFWFVVPHMNDIGINVLPRQCAPANLFEDCIKEIPLFRLMSNPARFTVFGKEFVCSRVDLL